MIKVGDRITINMIANDDVDLAEWLEDTNEDMQFIVTEVSEGSNLCWIKNCPYSISLSNIQLYNGMNYSIIW